MTPKNFILGSGLLGLLAKRLLGPSWEVIPYGRSRFYSFHPALDDNFIIRDERLDDFMALLGGRPSYFYKIAYSFGGSLQQSPELCEAWLNRLFGEELPMHLVTLLKNRSIFTVYDVRANTIYEQLLNDYMPQIRESSKHGEPISITKEEIVFAGKKVPYSEIISTIPLPSFASLCGRKMQLPAKQVWFHHILTNDLNFEGANQVRIVDDYSFFKCSQLAADRYLFYSFEDIASPGPYFAQFMNDFDIIDGTTITRCIPAGDLPDVSFANDYRTTLIGSSANWDWGLDTASAIIRLLKQH